MEFLKQNKKTLLITSLYAAALVLLLLVANLEAINEVLGKLFLFLRPPIIGLVLAYLCNPFFRFYETRLFSKIHPFPLRRALSLILAYLSIAAIIATLLMMILPQLFESIFGFLTNFDGYLAETTEDINGIIQWINTQFPKANGEALLPLLSADSIGTAIDDLYHSFFPEDFKLLDFFSAEKLTDLFNMAGNILSIVTDTVVGFFISVYLLHSKEKRYAQIMRARRALFSDERNEKLTRFFKTADRSFGGFFKGKLIDSAIIGVLTYIIISIFGVPYAILIAAVVAITDIVPVIGPFIGVIPSAIIIVLTDPPKIIPFLIAILIIQQIDGNIIAPKILGENTGVSSLCVIIAITTMGALWGFVGMILGVPLFATVLELGSSYLDSRLKKKGLPVETEYYATDSITELSQDEENKNLFRRLRDKKTATAADGGRGSTLSETEKQQLAMYTIARKHRVFSDGSEEALTSFTAEKEKMKGEKKPEEKEPQNKA